MFLFSSLHSLGFHFPLFSEHKMFCMQLDHHSPKLILHPTHRGSLLPNRDVQGGGTYAVPVCSAQNMGSHCFFYICFHCVATNAFTHEKNYLAARKIQQKNILPWASEWADAPHCQQPVWYVFTAPLLSFAVPLFSLIFRCKKSSVSCSQKSHWGLCKELPSLTEMEEHQLVMLPEWLINIEDEIKTIAVYRNLEAGLGCWRHL